MYAREARFLIALPATVTRLSPIDVPNGLGNNMPAIDSTEDRHHPKNSPLPSWSPIPAKHRPAPPDQSLVNGEPGNLLGVDRDGEKDHDRVRARADG